MIKFDKMTAKLSVSPKHCNPVAKKATKPQVPTYREAMSIF